VKNHVELQGSALHSLIKNRQLTIAGNSALKIYGTLSCSSGKRMKKENRVFFVDESEAIKNGYRPCGNCLNAAYKIWKHSKKQVD
jgi:methylphosphotriester-DNA--protein-cysteine methyltransferase